MKKFIYQDKEIVIYEYSDAERLIMKLSDLYAGDVTVVCSKGNGRNRIEYYNYPCSFDIETTTIRPGELDYAGTDEDPPIAFPYLFQWNIYDNVIMVREYRHALQIFAWITKYFRLADNRRLICFDHNLGYEHFYFQQLWDIEPEKCFALDDHHPVTIVTRDGWMFRDSYKMTNMSLESLTKDWSKTWKKDKEIMDYSLLRTPYSDLDDQTYIYSALDDLSLSEAIKAFLKARNEPIWTGCPTSTSFIRKELKKRLGVGIKKRSEEQKRYWKMLKKQNVSLEQYRLLQRLARGGNTHANRFYTGKILKDILHVDIVSSYPAQMVCYPEYPIGHWSPITPGSFMDTIELFESEGYCCMFDVVLMDPELKKGVPVPYISIAKMVIVEGSNMAYTDNGRYIGGLKAVQLSLFGAEWPIVKSQYDFSDAIIIRGWYARKGYLPDIIRKYILELYAKKTELKGVSGQEVEYALSKTYVNGIFGMAYTSVLRDQYEVTEEGIFLKMPEDPAEFLEKYQSSISYFMPYCWGALVACLGRVFLQRMIDTVANEDGTSDFIYCDTDSIFCLDPEKNRPKIRALAEELKAYHRKCGLQLSYKDIKGREHELGDISEEPYVEAMRVWGAKKYATVENGKLTCTVAGVPKKAGSRIIGSLDNFKIGLNFKGKDTGKNCLWYNPPPAFRLHDQEGREIEVHYNVAMLPCDYLLSIGRDYQECLSIEGNFHWKFKDGDKNTINEEDY